MNEEKQKLEFIIKELKDENKCILDVVKDIKEEIKKSAKEDDPLRAYQLADRDDAGAIRYFGYVKPDGSWLILRDDTTLRTNRWAKGDDLPRRTEAERNYREAWDNRAGLSYFLYFELF